jgi:uncharacterized membrane protein
MQNVLRKFLKKHKYYNQQKDFDEYFLSHPNYPSLYAVTDTLTLVGIENVAAKIPQEQFFELPESFLATYNNKLVLVEKTSKNVIITIADGTQQILLFNEFFEAWDGVVVAIGENEVENQARSKSYVKEIVFTVLVLFFVFSAIVNHNLSLSTAIGFALSIAGLFLSVMILNEKYDDGNESTLISKICTMNDNLSCNNVIQSQQARFFKSVDFSDLPILFFTTTTILIMVNTNYISTVGFLSLLAAPIVMYSLWLQKVVLQKWCLLCLSVGAVIFCTAAFSGPFLAKPNWNGLLLSVIFFSMVSFVWIHYRNILIANKDLLSNNRQLFNFKRNPTVYNLLKKPIYNKEKFHTIQAIELGSANNPTHLTLIVSPSCNHCHKAYEEALELMTAYADKFRLSVFFNVNPENYDNPYLKIVFNLLQINSQQNIRTTVEALNDWHVKKLPLETWMQKWDQGNIDESVVKELQLQYNWCQDNNFNYTPIKVVNDSLYPQEYTISELRFFTSQIEEEFETV